jgi:DNA-binding NtrC family response regulator
MEVNMPDMNGVQLYQEARKIQPGLTAILMTAYAADDMIKQAMAEGITTILDKSLDIGFLIVLFSAIQKIKLHSQ